MFRQTSSVWLCFLRIWLFLPLSALHLQRSAFLNCRRTGRWSSSFMLTTEMQFLFIVIYILRQKLVLNTAKLSESTFWALYSLCLKSVVLKQKWPIWGSAVSSYQRHTLPQFFLKTKTTLTIQPSLGQFVWVSGWNGLQILLPKHMWESKIRLLKQKLDEKCYVTFF